MNAEVDARSEVSQVLEKRGLAYEDFAEGGACVGVGIPLPKGNEIESDGACDSYVMINGGDEVADDSVLVDPNREVELEFSDNGNIEIDAEPKIEKGNDPKFCVSEEIGGVGHVVGKDLGESASNLLMNDIEVRNNVSDGDEKQGEDSETESSEKLEDVPKSEGSVCEAADDNCNNPQATCREDKQDVKIVSDSNVTVGEFGVLKSSITHTDAFVPGQNGDAVDKDDNGNQLNASPPNKNEEDAAFDEKNLILDEKHLVVNGEDSVVDQSGDKEEEVEQNLVTVPTTEVSVLLEKDNADDSITHGSGICLPAGQDQDGNLQTADDVESENAYDDCDIVSDETCATSIDSPTRMDIVGEGPFEDHALVVEKSSAESLDQDTCLVDDKDEQADGSISDDKGDELPNSPDENIASNTSMSNDLVLSSQNILEGNKHLENTAMASSIVMVGSVEIDCKKVFPSLPFNNAAIKSFHFSPAFENLRLDVKVKSSPESIDNPDSCCLQGTKIEAKSENGTVDEDTRSSCLSSDQGNLSHVSDVNEVESNGSTCQEVEVVDEIKWVSSFGTLECSTRDTAEPLNVVSEVGFDPVYSVRSSSYEEDTQSSCFSNDQGSINHASELNEVESDGSTCEEVKVIDETNSDLSFGTHSSTLDTAETLNVVAEVGSGPFYFVRIPRYEDEFIREKIKHAQSLVDEKTRIRDSFRDQIQTTKAACKEVGSNLSAAKSEARAARESLKLKRKEIETAQSMINKAKDALSINEIGIRINEMVHKMAHETLPLKEENQLIRDIKKLVQLRDQLSLDEGKQGELLLALVQKGEVEERLKLLRKEMDLIKADVLKADELTTFMLKKYDGEKEKLKGLQSQFEEADKSRQEAYVDLQCLKKPFDEKREYFRKYKNGMEVADNLAIRKDGEKLQAHAINQVETFMERWNNDDEFRKDYIRCNTKSTLRRLGTSDGRSRVPDEEQPVLNNDIEERTATDNLVSPGLTVEQNKPTELVETVKEDNHEPAKGKKKKKKKTKTKNPVAAVATLPDDQESVSGGVELADTKDSSGLDFADTREMHERSKEEEELEKRAEELRKEEEAIRLQEQLKLEEKAKSEIALARKKRKAERAQARAAIRAQKEAEEKEKEKEKKKARKKKKKKPAAEEAKNEADIEEEPQPAVSMETPTDIPETAEESKTTSTMSRKRPPSTKQNKAKAIIPPPLRKRGKRKMETWAWILFTVIIVLVLFLFFLDNGGYLGKLGMGRFS